MAHAEGFLNLVKDAKKRIKELSVQEVKKRLDAGDKIIICLLYTSPSPRD